MNKRLIADAQERLAFRGELFVQASIRNFKPSAFDLAYPRKLEDFNHARRVQARVQAQAEAADAGAETSGVVPLSQRAVWYPPLVRTLEFLARVYLNVDDAIFEEMAQEAVAACMAQFKSAAKLLAKQQSPLDGQLFLLKHLLALREQISAFEIGASLQLRAGCCCVLYTIYVYPPWLATAAHLLSRPPGLPVCLVALGSDFVATERSLDVGGSPAGGDRNWIVRQFMRGRRAMSTAPRVKVTLVDSKKQLEAELKAACDGFIALATQIAVGPLLELLRRVSPWTGELRGLGRGRSAPPRALRLESFGAPSAVVAVLADVQRRMADSLGLLLSQMRAYLDNPVTQTILFRPVRNAIASGTAEVRSVISEAQGYRGDEIDTVCDALRRVEEEVAAQEKEIAERPASTPR